jgi:hypothetical protein
MPHRAGEGGDARLFNGGRIRRAGDDPGGIFSAAHGAFTAANVGGCGYTGESLSVGRVDTTSRSAKQN